jgi:hypothetical protein
MFSFVAKLRLLSASAKDFSPVQAKKKTTLDLSRN